MTVSDPILETSNAHFPVNHPFGGSQNRSNTLKYALNWSIWGVSNTSFWERVKSYLRHSDFGPKRISRSGTTLYPKMDHPEEPLLDHFWDSYMLIPRKWWSSTGPESDPKRVQKEVNSTCNHRGDPVNVVI